LSNHLLPAHRNVTPSRKGRVATRQIDEEAAIEAARMKSESQLRLWDGYLGEIEAGEVMRSGEMVSEEAITRGQRNPALSPFYSEVAARHCRRMIELTDRPHRSRP